MAGLRVWSVLIGIMAVVVGWTLLFRPFASLTVLLLLVVVGLLLMAAARAADLERPWAPLDLLPPATRSAVAGRMMQAAE